MAFPKKGLRKIVVDGKKYVYNVTGNDGWISFSIGLLESNGEILTGGFTYHPNIVTKFDKNGKVKSWSGYQRIRITPDTIRQLIEYGLDNGWNPVQNKGQLRLKNLDEKIELNLKDATAFPNLVANQIVVTLANKETGRFLKTDGEEYRGEGDIFHVFDSIEIAKQFARKTIEENDTIECWLLSEKNKAISYMNNDVEKFFDNE